MSEYPNLWKRGVIQARVRALANHRCENCDMEFEPGTNKAKTHKAANGRPIIGTVHHIDENKANCSMTNLVYLCQRCHFTIHIRRLYVGNILPRGYQNTAPRWMVKRGLPYRLNPNVLNAPGMYERSLL